MGARFVIVGAALRVYEELLFLTLGVENRLGTFLEGVEGCRATPDVLIIVKPRHGCPEHFCNLIIAELAHVEVGALDAVELARYDIIVMRSFLVASRQSVLMRQNILELQERVNIIELLILLSLIEVAEIGELIHLVVASWRVIKCQIGA